MSGPGLSGGVDGTTPYARIRIAATAAGALSQWGANSGAVILSTLAGAAASSSADIAAGQSLPAMCFASWYSVALSPWSVGVTPNVATVDIGTVQDPGTIALDVSTTSAAAAPSGLDMSGGTPLVSFTTAGGVAKLAVLTNGAMEILIAFQIATPDVSGVVTGTAT